MRRIRKDLDAKNVFLHFTQEQLNAQVVSLESVVRNLKTENHLLNKGIKNLVDQVQSEKKKYEELSEQYNSDNAEAEIEFKNLEVEMEENKIKAKNLEIELRAKLGEAEFEKCELTRSVDELKRDLEVSENDKVVLKDQLEFTEKSVTEIALDLAEVSKLKQKLTDENEEYLKKFDDFETKLKENETNFDQLTNDKHEIEEKAKLQNEEIEMLQKSLKETDNELKEIEMSKVGLEGANAALGEEVQQLDICNQDLKQQLDTLETDKEKLSEEINDLKISRQEVEESLIQTQGLVEDMEIKMMEAHTKHREEASDLADKLKKTTAALDNVKDERSSLLEMNTALSGQVAEALHSIHNLQHREDSLQQELMIVKQFMEAAQHECEEDRMRMMQAEDEILSLQAEMEDAISRADDAEVRANHYSNESEKLRVTLDHVRKEMTASCSDLNSQLTTLKAAYNSSVDELSESKTVGRQLLEQLSSVEEELSAKKEDNAKILKDFEDRNEEALNEMDSMVQTFEQEKSLFHDKIIHLEKLRDNLEVTVSEKTEALHSMKNDLDNLRQKEEFATCKVEEVTKTNLRLKGNLELRATENLKLKEQVETMVKDYDALKTESDADKEKLKTVENEKCDIDRLRSAELEMCIKLREKLSQAEKEAERGESAVRSMEAQQVIVMEAEAKLEEEKQKYEDLMAVVTKYKERLEEMESLMKAMDERNEDLEAKAAEAEEALKSLQDMIEPFKEQLEGFEMEKKALLSSQEASKEEVNIFPDRSDSLLSSNLTSQ